MAHDKDLSIKGPSKSLPVKETKFTYGQGDYAILDKGGHIIGEAFGVNGPNRSADSKANAQLWAAAPELLEACEEALDLVGELTDASQYLELYQSGGDLQEKLRAAITKASSDFGHTKGE